MDVRTRRKLFNESFQIYHTILPGIANNLTERRVVSIPEKKAYTRILEDSECLTQSRQHIFIKPEIIKILSLKKCLLRFTISEW